MYPKQVMEDPDEGGATRIFITALFIILKTGNTIHIQWEGVSYILWQMKPLRDYMYICKGLCEILTSGK